MNFKWIISCQLLVGSAPSRSQQGLSLVAVLFEHFDVGAKIKNQS